MSDPRRAANFVRGLAIDAVEAARSGHPGMPLGTADMATAVFTRFLKHDPTDPSWPDRDRFVLSAGHGSALLYSLLHLSGYDVTIDDLKKFRQWGSRTPGHPEVGHTSGVETTTGPLGQGFANGVGMAIAERYLRERFGADLVDHRVYGIVSDGDLMEGVSSEAASTAGHLGLGRIVYLYDDNHITIDGDTALSFTEDVGARFRAYGWHVVACDGHDPVAVAAAITESRDVEDRPSLVMCRTTIGFASSKAGSEKSHGAPLGADDVAATKVKLGLDPTRSFDAPSDVVAAFRAHDGPARRAAWIRRLDAHPERATFLRWMHRDGDALVDDVTWPSYADGSAPATRKVSEACLKGIVAAAPWVLGGSADLAESNGVALGLPGLRKDDFTGSVVQFGVREHAMGSIANGMALHGGVLPYCATFLIFHDYMRPAVRLAALMKQPVIYVYSHDSVFLGEDGPTHQPVETLLALRSIPGMAVYRPGDARETVAAWKAALRRKDGPTALIVTRQGLPTLPGTNGREEDAIAGAYVVVGAGGHPDVVLVATGSELGVAAEAAALLHQNGVAARVVSAPRREILHEDRDLRDALLPAGVPVVAIEAALTLGWERYVGDGALLIGIDTFGHSAKASDIAEHLGFTPAAVAERVRLWLAR